MTKANMSASAPAHSDPEDSPKSLRIMVYAAWQKGIVAPSKELSRPNYVLCFEDLKTPKRFDEYDGVIVFQGTFEQFNVGSTIAELVVFDKDELDKRMREFNLLVDGGGFTCFILCEPFYEGDEYNDWRATDLVKRVLSDDFLFRANFPSRVSPVTPKLSEFKSFIERFGAAHSWFDPMGSWERRPIAMVGTHLVGMTVGRHIFCIPAQLPIAKRGKVPEANPDTEEFFELLADAVVSVVKKQAVALPAWVDGYQFDEERTLLEQRAALAEQLASLDSKVDAFKRFKWILVRAGDDLVDSVKHVLEAGFGFKVEVDEQYREDAKIVGEDGKPVVLLEITGVNAGVQRDKVGQADYHRERAGLAETFPSVLIVNANIKKARSLEEKDQPVASDQVRHAKKLGVLILRTLDLLRLLVLHQRGAVSKADVERLLTTESGWLKITDAGCEVMVDG